MKHMYEYLYDTIWIWRSLKKLDTNTSEIRLCLYIFIITTLLLGIKKEAKRNKEQLNCQYQPSSICQCHKSFQKNYEASNIKYMPKVHNKKLKSLLISTHINGSFQLSTSIASTSPSMYILQFSKGRDGAKIFAWGGGENTHNQKDKLIN